MFVQATQEILSHVPECTEDEFEAAISSATKAFPQWKETPVTARARIMLKFQELIRRDMVGGLTLSETSTLHHNPFFLTVTRTNLP